VCARKDRGEGTFPDEEGTEILKLDQLAMDFLAGEGTFPDEEGTEIGMPRSPLCCRTCEGTFPDEEGTEIGARNP